MDYYSFTGPTVQEDGPADSYRSREMQGYITNKDVVSTVISDRPTAITNAIYDARAHADRFNILLIIGKGNERWIKDHRKHVPFDGDDHVVERMFGL